MLLTPLPAVPWPAATTWPLASVCTPAFIAIQPTVSEAVRPVEIVPLVQLVVEAGRGDVADLEGHRLLVVGGGRSHHHDGVLDRRRRRSTWYHLPLLRLGDGHRAALADNATSGGSTSGASAASVKDWMSCAPPLKASRTTCTPACRSTRSSWPVWKLVQELVTGVVAVAVS